jgi:hypothetical protein
LVKVKGTVWFVVDDDLDKPDDIRHKWALKKKAARMEQGLHPLTLEEREKELVDKESIPDDDDDAFVKKMKEIDSVEDDGDEEEDEEEEILVDGLDEGEVEEAIKEEISELPPPDIGDYMAVLPVDVEFQFIYDSRRGMSTRFGFT